ncbi:MAG: alpha/beta fold hydrolase [Magnetospirillum sp.]
MPAAIESWLSRCGQDAVLARCSQGLDVVVEIAALPAGAWRQVFGNGKGGTIRIAADPDNWKRLLGQATPLPGWQSFGAIIRLNPDFQVTGDTLDIAQSLAALERMIELARPAAPPLPAPVVERDPSQVSGHMRRLVHRDGTAHHLGWQQAGEGSPLLMLHTAGADSRQFAHQLSDIELASRWRMLAFDMPGHGRSGPPPGWQDGEAYRLSLEGYRDWCVAFIEQVVGEPVVVTGCSMGAAMALVLAAHRPDLIKAVIALEAPWRAPGRRSPLLADARINAQLHNPSYVRGLLGPRSPAQYRDEACWIYSQAGFGIYAGDLAFYSDEFDGAAIAADLAALPHMPIHLLTGEYDYSASPDNTRQLADAIGHATFVPMPGLGHFPMIEHPDYFRGYFTQALDDVRRRLPQ